MLLNFSDRTRTGVFNMVWPLPREAVKLARLEMHSWQCWVRLGFFNQGFSACGIQTTSLAACLANFVREFFQLLDLYTGEPNSYYPRGREAEKEKRESARNVDRLQPVEPILSRNFSNFPIFILGSPILITPDRGREAEKEKRESSRNGWDTGVSLPWASKLDHLQPLELNLLQKISTIPTFILGAPFSYYPRELKMDKVRGKEQKWQQHPVFPGGLPSKY